MNAWLKQLRRLVEERRESVLVTVAGVRGSAPREPGARMIVTASELHGSIGGGQLEFQCAALACKRLQAGAGEAAVASMRTFPLGAGLGQCCGGVVEVLFEAVPAKGAPWLSEALRLYDQRIPLVIVTSLDENGALCKAIVTADEQCAYGQWTEVPEALVAIAHRMLERRQAAMFTPGTDRKSKVWMEPVMPGSFHVALFGAGHVGSAVVSAMAGLDCHLRWVDSRRNTLPAALPDHVVAVECEHPAREVLAMPPGSYYLVMTHSHPLDYEICEAVLRRDDFAYCGLIGSVSKRRRFENLMRRQGMSEALLTKLTCPIGIRGVGGKKPQEIAISVVAQLLQQSTAAAVATGDVPSGNVHQLRR